MTLAGHILSFQRKLKLDIELPEGVEVLNPYKEEVAVQLCERFYNRYYNDNDERVLILGINPGRFGGGITGIPFTDPVKLEMLGIKNELPKKRELSADFIYEMIDAFGGAQLFYKKFYVSAVSPLGFVKNEKNLNYYDIRHLSNMLEKFMVKCLNEQLSWGMSKTVCFCLGEGENYKFIKSLNAEYKFFNEIVPLPHPRFIMQYRRKRLSEFIAIYKQKLFP